MLLVAVARRRCNTLRTSGFVDDVTFSSNRPYGGAVSVLPRFNVVYGLTPLHRTTGCSVLSQAPRLEEFIVEGLPERSMRCTSALLTFSNN